MLTANIEAYNQFSNGTIELNGYVYPISRKIELSFDEVNKLCNQLNLILKLKDIDTQDEFTFPLVENQ